MTSEKNLWNSALDRAAISIVTRLDQIDSVSAVRDMEAIIFPVWSEAVTEMNKYSCRMDPLHWENLSEAEKKIQAPPEISYSRFSQTIIEALQRVFFKA